MSAAVQTLSVRERTGGREGTEYLEFWAKLAKAVKHINWLTTDELVHALVDLIDAGYSTDEARRLEAYSKLIEVLSERVFEEKDSLDFDEEPMHRPTLDFIDKVMRGGRETA
jgi:hypothetical protein